ncbi:MAG: hypothetical protein JWR67_2795 [Mucilaginibacter sp.]|nr:hypothetical protein [Mucilaginibacter sp.]
MKKIMSAILGVMLLSVIVTNVKAQEPGTALNEAYHTLQMAPGMPEMMGANNKFNLIAAKFSNDWAANYYAAYAKAYIATKEKEAKRKDQLLDEADKYVDKVNAIKPSSDESMVLTAYVAFARFLVDPANRWKKYLTIMNDNLEKAKKANPDNPRIYYLEGVPVFNKPKLFGGGKNKAKPYFEKASALFAKQDTSTVQKPSWGEKENAEYLAKCRD